jgi:hypothetical protein
MKELHIGDKVLTASGDYKPIFMKIHWNPSRPTEFLQIHSKPSSSSAVSVKDGPLELTPSHLLYLEEDHDSPIPAEDVKVGDILAGSKSPRIVTKINKVVKNGFYNFLTSDGTIVVDGVIASVHTKTIYDGAPVLQYMGGISGYNRIVPPLLQAFCSKITAQGCLMEFDDGHGGFENGFQKFGNFFMAQDWYIQSILLVLILVFVVACHIYAYFLHVLLAVAFVRMVVMGFNQHSGMSLNFSTFWMMDKRGHDNHVASYMTDKDKML